MRVRRPWMSASERNELWRRWREGESLTDIARALERALAHLREAEAARAAGVPHDLLTIDVRAAARALGEVTGEAIDETVLAEIFSRFCIGK